VQREREVEVVCCHFQMPGGICQNSRRRGLRTVIRNDLRDFFLGADFGHRLKSRGCMRRCAKGVSSTEPRCALRLRALMISSTRSGQRGLFDRRRRDRHHVHAAAGRATTSNPPHSARRREVRPDPLMEVATMRSRVPGCGGGVPRVQRVIGMPSTGSPLLPSTVTFATDSGGALNLAHRTFRPGSKSLL
jgi:hypothetical protein